MSEIAQDDIPAHLIAWYRHLVAYHTDDADTRKLQQEAEDQLRKLGLEW